MKKIVRKHCMKNMYKTDWKDGKETRGHIDMDLDELTCDLVKLVWF